MRKLLYIMYALTLLCIASCHNDYKDYFTAGHIILTLPVDAEIETIQYSVKMTNLNSRNTITLAGESKGTITVDNLFTGAYSINVEGVVRYIDGNGNTFTSLFRAQSDYVEMVELNDYTISLEMILMN